MRHKRKQTGEIQKADTGGVFLESDPLLSRFCLPHSAFYLVSFCASLAKTLLHLLVRTNRS
jgi:hypothetical protein